MNRILSVFFCVVAAVVTSGLVGCGATPKKFDVEVGLAPDLRAFTVPVDIIGVNNESELEAWKSQDVDKYWAAGSDKRAGANKYEMKFTPGGPDTQMVKVTDKKWEDWNKPTAIVIFAQIPQYSGDRAAGDQRRKVLETMSDSWEEEMLRVAVRKSGLAVLSHQKKK